MTRTLRLSDNDTIELEGSEWLFYFDLIDVVCELEYREILTGRNVNRSTNSREIRGNALIHSTPITVLSPDGNRGTVFSHCSASFYPITKLRDPPQIMRVGGQEVIVEGELIHGSPMDRDQSIAGQSEFLAIHLGVPKDVFDAVWDDLKFAQGKTDARFQAMISVYRDVGIGGCYIEANRWSSAGLSSISVARRSTHLSAQNSRKVVDSIPEDGQLVRRFEIDIPKGEFEKMRQLLQGIRNTMYFFMTCTVMIALVTLSRQVL